MTEFEVSGTIILTLAAFSIFVVVRILKVFYIDDLGNFNTSSVVFISMLNPKLRLKVFLLSATLVASVTLTIISIAICLFAHKGIELLVLITIGHSMNIVFTMVFINRMKCYEQLCLKIYEDRIAAIKL